jgi:hypothetical protein
MRIKPERQVRAEQGVKRSMIGFAEAFVRRFNQYGARDFSKQDFEFLHKALRPYLSTPMLIEEITQLYTAVRWGLNLPEAQRNKIVVPERPRQIVEKRTTNRFKPLIVID